MITTKALATFAAYDRFLYAGVGEDKNGMELTLLSALARQDVDPWQKAADLSRLPGETAMRSLTALLECLPGQASLVERTALASRLISLLPRPAEIRRRVADNPSRPKPQPGNPLHVTELMLVLIYFVAMIVCGWWFSSHWPTIDTAQPAAAVAPVGAVRDPPALGSRNP